MRIFAERSHARAVMSSCRRYGRTTCTEKAMSNGVRTAVVVVCGLFIGGLGASGMPVQAHAQGWVAVAAESKGRWGYASGSEPRREREPRPCGAAARADAISRKQRGLLPRLCGEPCGRILIWRRPRSHAERGPLHGPVRMRAGRAGSNVPSREGALRVTDRDIRAGCVPARTSQRASTHGGRT